MLLVAILIFMLLWSLATTWATFTTARTSTLDRVAWVVISTSIFALILIEYASL